MVEVAGVAMIGRPRTTGPAPRALPRPRCPRRRGRGAAQKRKRQSVNRMRHRRRARPRRPARATGPAAGHRAGLCYGLVGATDRHGLVVVGGREHVLVDVGRGLDALAVALRDDQVVLGHGLFV